MQQRCCALIQPAVATTYGHRAMAYCTIFDRNAPSESRVPPPKRSTPPTAIRCSTLKPAEEGWSKSRWRIGCGPLSLLHPADYLLGRDRPQHRQCRRSWYLPAGILPVVETSQSEREKNARAYALTCNRYGISWGVLSVIAFSEPKSPRTPQQPRAIDVRILQQIEKIAQAYSVIDHFPVPKKKNKLTLNGILLAGVLKQNPRPRAASLLQASSPRSQPCSGEPNRRAIH